jgi:predicted nucleic acid-binding protein
MRFIVVDASVAVKWYVNETGSEKAVALLENEDLFFLAPDIFLAEAVNALLRQQGAGQLVDEALDKALRDLTFSRPELVSSTRLIDRAVVIARAIRHPIYDCLYLALAKRWETVFVTADAEFVDRCRNQLPTDPITKRLRLLEEFGI